MKLYIILALCCLAPWVRGLSSTNKIYVEDDGFLSLNYAEKIEVAKKTRESLPAESFPEGNWGLITNGFHLSLRFEKEVFTNGEPIAAIILLRNISDKVLTYRAAFPSGAPQAGPIALKVFTETGEMVAPIANDFRSVSTRGRSLHPESQHKYLQPLDKEYNLKTNGTYFVTARLVVPSPNLTIVESAKVKVVIAN
jgi:hypothetical protein